MKTTRSMFQKLVTRHSSFVTAAFAAFAANAADISDVIVRQQWPWSTDVKVEYKVTGVTTPVDVSVTAFNGARQLDATNLASAMTGDRFGISESGAYSFTIDPVKAFGTDRIALGDFRVRLSLSASATNINEVIYKVFDLSTGACTDLSRADFYNGKVESGDFVTNFADIGSGFTTSLDDVFIWTGVTNNIKYKTTHLVMRKIPAANVTWTMGAPASERWKSDKDQIADGSETNHLVRLTSDYYASVFEVTQKQYFLVKNANYANAAEQEREEADILPETGMNPGQAKQFASAFSTRSGESFALLTDAQWEFACRAGTTTALYSGFNVNPAAFWSGGDSHVNEIAWYSANSGTQTHAVGCKAPNAFGLYDMLGNVNEWTQDYYCNGATYVATFGAGWQPGDVVVDPQGLQTSESVEYTSRGGRYNHTALYHRSAVRQKGIKEWVTGVGYSGLRVGMAVSGN